ncbi:putative phospholipid-transporting ATPase [Phytophthora fragariae]|uniref:Phospholipid-transporting ATPase n=1 Tax=Phytophthora fragariae TaxID=53985 RepID=A0A6A4DTC1_9STRA|nr:putative phospholipid-transporting ATPase [Phytophthora fragariae]KAE9116946.1 putative phospholipid-transporting ATPase [Phytophthora fragariae]KAE9313901.1 putative phospholipid-transporting ATPase [Phytophthora fragariae]
MATAAGNFRKVHLNNDEENERLRREGRYTDNYVTTSKYTIVSFVPKMLFEFFRVIANCYFLVISILQVATTWSPTNKYTTAGPLVIVLLVSMIKQGVEDKKRHDADNVQNSRHCKVLGRHGEIVTKEWQEGESSSSNDKGDDDKHHDPRDAQVDFNPLIHFDDPRLINALADNGPEAAAIDEFLTVLSVCHTVIPENNAKTGEVDYRASSPDEEALVKAAKCLGYNFFAPAPLLEVKVTTKQGVSAVRKYTILNVNEFNSTRKRMSITLRTEDGRYFLYCKGADNVMMPRSKIDEHTAKMDEELKRFASEGLRTLVICSKELTEEEYLAWDVMYQEAVTSLTNRDELLEEVAELIETEMKIVGASAIEDKLQKGVPTAIANLAQAGIKIWMLTGDKEETAINIGHACQLINDGMRLLIVNCEDLDDLGRQVDKIYKLDDVQSHINSNKVSSHLALVCDGKAMVHVFPPKNATSERALHAAKVLSQMILEISSVCQAVIACRVSPAQKADIVNLIRYNSPQKPIALAIGEEANDENMIQSAHVGVGVSGQEGVQAVNASDYAIAQFRFLERLLLVHGRYNYQRISKIILYSFYKNVALVIALFLFNFYNGQSGTSVFESFIMAGWNFFLALPIIAIGIFDEDVAPEQVLRNPVLYLPGQKNEGINMKRFSTWLFNAIVQAFICFMLAMYGTINVGGFSAGLYLQGSVIYSVLLMSANLKVILETLSWTKFNRLVLAFSLWLFFFFLLVFPFMGSLGRDLYGVSLQLLSSAVFWLYLLLVPLTANLIDICIKYIQNIYFPTLANVLRERCVLSANSAQVACDPLDEQKSGLLSVPFYELYKGFVFSSAETDGGDKDERDSRELTSLKVLEFHREAVASFTKERSASFSPTGAIVPGPSTSSAHLSGHFSSSHLSAHHSQRGT